MPGALLKYTNNTPVPSVLTLVEGNTLRVKLEGVSKSHPLQAKVDQANVVAVGKVVHNARADSWQFEFEAKQAGLARISIASSSAGFSVSPAVVTVKVEAALALPETGTEAGMLVRLLLAESRSPAYWGSSTIDDVKKGMQWMRRVIANRLNSDKPEEFMAKGARTMGDIITADDRGSVQFHGFNRYPELPSGIAGNISDVLAVANNGTHPQRTAYFQFVQAAIEVAAQPLPADPSPTGLFAWRTERSNSPGDEFRQFGTSAGNTFYTHTRLKKKD